MRTYGRVTNPLTGVKTWQVVTTDANGFNDAVYLTTLIQVLLLNPGESPFYANYGIPAQQSLIQQFFPDFYVNRTQQQFAQFFGSLIVSKQESPDPYYTVNVITKAGSKQILQVPY